MKTLSLWRGVKWGFFGIFWLELKMFRAELFSTRNRKSWHLLLNRISRKKTLITVRLTIWNRLSIELEHYLKFPGKSHHLFQKDFFVTLKNRRMWGRRVRWDPRRCRPARLMKLILAGLCVSRIDGNFLERSSMSTPTHSKPIEISLLKVVFNR